MVARLGLVAAGCSYTRFVGKIPTPVKIKLALPPPPSKKAQNPPQKEEFYGQGGFSSRKNQKMPGAHKIGAAISGPRITGGNFMDTTLFLTLGDHRDLGRALSGVESVEEYTPARMRVLVSEE